MVFKVQPKTAGAEMPAHIDVSIFQIFQVYLYVFWGEACSTALVARVSALSCLCKLPPLACVEVVLLFKDVLYESPNTVLGVAFLRLLWVYAVHFPR